MILSQDSSAVSSEPEQCDAEALTCLLAQIKIVREHERRLVGLLLDRATIGDQLAQHQRRSNGKGAIKALGKWLRSESELSALLTISGGFLDQQDQRSEAIREMQKAQEACPTAQPPNLTPAP